jgi:hypothetical protein
MFLRFPSFCSTVWNQEIQRSALLIQLALSLTGCVSDSPGIPNLYLLKLRQGDDNFEIRVGYFGMAPFSIEANHSDEEKVSAEVLRTR